MNELSQVWEAYALARGIIGALLRRNPDTDTPLAVQPDAFTAVEPSMTAATIGDEAVGDPWHPMVDDQLARTARRALGITNK